jgi:histidinol-phosphate phosphatase family protein
MTKGTEFQAVILCGGLGTRLRPITDNLPKPMAPVNGKPFLHYLIEQLAKQGVKKFLLLTGYLGHHISEYFGDGSIWNLNISYSNGPTEWDTGRRIWEAKEKIDPIFLLLYSDNFVQFRLQTLLKLYQTHKLPISLLLAPKEKGNISISEDGRIQAYDKNRNGEGFDFVEVGYMIIEKEQVLESFPTYSGFPDFNFSQVLQKFAGEGEIAGLVVRDAYHSISDIERLKKMSDYLSHKKIILIDRDGTINVKAPHGEYICTVDEFHFIPDTYNAMKQLASEGYEFIVITNQAGIARKKYTEDDLGKIHEKMIDTFSKDYISILKIYYSPHHWNENSFMRKPQPGMFFEASKEFTFRMDKVLYIGDDPRDCEAAYNAGCSSLYIGSPAELVNLSPEQQPIAVFDSMLQSMDLIRSFYNISNS